MNSRRALAFIFCTVTLDVLALGLMIPVLPRIVLGFMGGDTAGAAEMFGAFSTVWALMQFFFSPLLGVVSDRYGRRPGQLAKEESDPITLEVVEQPRTPLRTPVEATGIAVA